MRSGNIFLRMLFPLILSCVLLVLTVPGYLSRHHVAAARPLATAFAQAEQETGVPASLLKAICYMEGRLNNHDGSPSIDGGYGCMHLVKNKHTDTLTRAASILHVSTQQLQMDVPTNIRGGAAILREYALRRSPTQQLPAHLADWYGPVAAYSHAGAFSTRKMYADSVYKLLNTGFTARTEAGETITLTVQHIRPNLASAALTSAEKALPRGCVDDGNVEFPGAINCILDPALFDCNSVQENAPCTYEGASRPTEHDILQVVIHDIEGTALDGLNVFQDVKSGVSMHYVVDSDGTIYQLLRETAIGYQAGNYWYNQHSIAIEHAGFAAQGWQWYNATQYLASAKLTAHLLARYNIPLDRDHIVAHGAVPSPTLAATNHVDPGPYWLWDYYFELIAQQKGLSDQQGLSTVQEKVLGIPLHDKSRSYDSANLHGMGETSLVHPGLTQDEENNSAIVSLHPPTSKRPYGNDGRETSANFNYFYLYTGPSTASTPLRTAGNGKKDVLDETNNVEVGMSYYYLDKVKDPAGTGYTLYQIWYGAQQAVQASQPDRFARAVRVWLAVPPDTAREGQGTPVQLRSATDTPVPIYGRPTSERTYIIGDAPRNAIFISGYTVREGEADSQWYQINYNHRQAWVPASSVQIVD